jgi:hypothetical protein
MLSTANQRWMASCGIVSMLVLLIGLWVIAGFVPPPSPSLSLQDIAAIYADNQLSIIVGLIITLYGSTLIMPWVVAISMQMRRIERAPYPMSWLQLSLGVMLVLEFLFATLFWLAAAYRPLENIEITARLHDIGGIMYVGMPMTTMLEAVVFGIVILQDKREHPVFPRWLAYLSFWAAFSFVFGSLNYLMHSGPIAYDGLLAWWLGLIVFTIWMAAVTISLLKDAIPGQERENAAISAGD